MELEQLFKQCGFSKRYEGYGMFEECLRITLADEDNFLFITGVYMEAGKKSGRTWKQVERNIRTMLDYAWREGGKEKVEMMAGCALKYPPTVSECLEIFTYYIKTHPEIKIRKE